MKEDTKPTSGADGEEIAGSGMTPMVISLNAGVPRHRVIPMAEKLGMTPERVGNRKDRVYSMDQAGALIRALREDDRLIRSRRILQETCRQAVKVHRTRAAALQAGGRPL